MLIFVLSRQPEVALSFGRLHYQRGRENAYENLHQDLTLQTQIGIPDFRYRVSLLTHGEWSPNLPYTSISDFRFQFFLTNKALVLDLWGPTPARQPLSTMSFNKIPYPHISGQRDLLRYLIRRFA